MAYYEDYIRERAEQAFDYSDATITLYDRDYEEQDGCLDDRHNGQLFEGAMREMVAYLYERRNELDGDSIEILTDPENVENIYISAVGLEAPMIVVEYEETPEWFEMENADLREFYHYPKPAHAGEWTAGYFQPR